MTTFDPDRMLADMRARQKATDERVDRICARAGMKPASRRTSRRKNGYSSEGMTAEEIERDTASIHKVLRVWRMIGKREPSPLTLPSGQTIVPKLSTGDRLSAKREYAVTRPRRHGGGLS
jgi:hypothetical protein